MFKKKGQRKRRGMKRRGNKRPKARPIPLNPAVQGVQRAQMTETAAAPASGIGPAINANSAYMSQFSISMFPRAVKMAQLFKFYRAKRVIWEYLPDQTTFQAGAGQVQIPYVYYIMNRDGITATGQVPSQYLASGARPIKFTQKILVSYKPNTIQIADIIMNSSLPAGSNQNTTLGRTPMYDKWFSTEGLLNQSQVAPTVDRVEIGAYQQVANTIAAVQYFGHDIFFNQQGAQPEVELGHVSVTVEWEFKVPTSVNSNSDV